MSNFPFKISWSFFTFIYSTGKLSVVRNCFFSRIGFTSLLTSSYSTRKQRVVIINSILTLCIDTECRNPTIYRSTISSIEVKLILNLVTLNKTGELYLAVVGVILSQSVLGVTNMQCLSQRLDSQSLRLDSELRLQFLDNGVAISGYVAINNQGIDTSVSRMLVVALELNGIGRSQCDFLTTTVHSNNLNICQIVLVTIGDELSLRIYGQCSASNFEVTSYRSNFILRNSVLYGSSCISIRANLSITLLSRHEDTSLLTNRLDSISSYHLIGSINISQVSSDDTLLLLIVESLERESESGIGSTKSLRCVVGGNLQRTLGNGQQTGLAQLNFIVVEVCFRASFSNLNRHQLVTILVDILVICILGHILHFIDITERSFQALVSTYQTGIAEGGGRNGCCTVINLRHAIDVNLQRLLGNNQFLVVSLIQSDGRLCIVTLRSERDNIATLLKVLGCCVSVILNGVVSSHQRITKRVVLDGQFGALVFAIVNLLIFRNNYRVGAARNTTSGGEGGYGDRERTTNCADLVIIVVSCESYLIGIILHILTILTSNSHLILQSGQISTCDIHSLASLVQTSDTSNGTQRLTGILSTLVVEHLAGVSNNNRQRHSLNDNLTGCPVRVSRGGRKHLNIVCTRHWGDGTRSIRSLCVTCF